MFCPYCGAGVPAASAVCASCGRTLTRLEGFASDATVLAGADVTIANDAGGYATRAGTPMPGIGAPAGPPRPGAPGTPLAPGSAFGSRYHIIRLLGVGGMGAVYQAWDDALAVAVALKVIRPEITADPAAARDLERRFKRELLLARQVTHKNVVRIHDLGEIDGIKYLTMPYIQGSDLATILARERRLPVSRAIAITRQVVAGLVAAHDAGVVHRDLKPANVMVDADDQAVIMDFGIARSVSAGATAAGAVVGTLEYMAPEQAMAQPVDHRADIYALGLMLYDMVLGPRQASRAESAVAELMARVQGPLPAARSLDPAIPEALERVIDRCTQPDPGARYQSTSQLAQDLELLDPSGRASGTAPLAAPPITRHHAVVAPAARTGAIRWALAALLVLTVAAAGWLGFRAFSDPAPAGADGVAAQGPVALAILPFRNASGNASLDWLGPSLAELIGGDVGQSARLRLVSSERVFRLLGDLGVTPQADMDAGSLRRISEFTNAHRIVSGQFVQLGQQIRLEARIHGGGVPVVLTASAAGEGDLLRAAQELANGIQKALALTDSAIRELEANSFTPSSRSVPALRQYSEGLQRARAGEHMEAAARYQASIESDPGFALAHSRLAEALARLGKSGDAERASRTAVDLSSDLPPVEREMILGAHARVTNDLDTAIASYERLMQGRPGDVQLRFELADLLERKGLLERARDEFRAVLGVEPKYGDALYAAGRVAIKLGDFQGSLEPLNQALTLSVQLDNRQAKAQVLQALGIAYKNLNKLDDALRQYSESLDIKRQIGDQRGIAASLSEIAQIHERQGRPDDAVRSYTEALEIGKQIGDTRGVGLTLINIGAAQLDNGRHDQALKAFRDALQTQRELGDEEAQAICLSNIGNAHMARGEYEEARTYLERALELRQKLNVPGSIALTSSSLGHVSTRLGEYAAAEKHYLRALELWRAAGDARGAAIGAYGLGELREQQGRFGTSLRHKTEALEAFRSLGDRSYWFGEILTGYGSALNQVGRSTEAQDVLAEALAYAREIRNRTLIAHGLILHGENAFLFGEIARARALWEEAVQTAQQAGSRFHILKANVNLARLAAAAGRPSAAADLRRLIQEADQLGLKHISAEASLFRGEALLKTGQVVQAAAELESSLAKSERLESWALLARTHALLGDAKAANGDRTGAAAHTARAKEFLDDMRRETGGDALLARRDLQLAQGTAGRAASGK